MLSAGKGRTQVISLLRAKRENQSMRNRILFVKDQGGGGAEDSANFCVGIIEQKVTSHPIEIELNSRLVGDERWRLDL